MCIYIDVVQEVVMFFLFPLLQHTLNMCTLHCMSWEGGRKLSWSYIMFACMIYLHVQYRVWAQHIVWMLVQASSQKYRVPDLSFRNSDILLSVLLTFSYMYPRLIWTYWSFFSHLHCAWCFSPLSSSHSQVAVLVWYMLMIRFHYCIFVKKKKK